MLKSSRSSGKRTTTDRKSAYCMIWTSSGIITRRSFFIITAKPNLLLERGISMVDKKDVAKAYEKYAGKFTPKPKYFINSLKAFAAGGAICTASLWLENRFIASGVPEKDAGVYVVIILVMLAQLLTGLGWFDTIGKHVGAGVIVPITGFANSMVAPALEYKKEGIVLGVGAKLFSLAGPVLVSGITVSAIIGVVYWVLDKVGM